MLAWLPDISCPTLLHYIAAEADEELCEDGAFISILFVRGANCLSVVCLLELGLGLGLWIETLVSAKNVSASFSIYFGVLLVPLG